MRSNRSTILVIEDQVRERDALSRMLRMEGFEILSTSNAEEAASMTRCDVDLVISDLRLGQASGLDVLQVWQQRRPSTPFIMMTAFGEVSTAVNAMKLGAVDYLTKPIRPEELLLLIRRQLPNSDVSPEQLEIGPTGLGRLIGHSPSMKSIFERIKRVAASDSIVLITGESGTGKELVAAAIHEHSHRKSGPYLAINMAAIPEGLAEAELFGVSKGAFTGAIQDRPGIFTAANRGTLFIDEIGDFPLGLQPKLLRILEEYIVCPVGSTQEHRVDVRVVAATSRNLFDLTTISAFRADLLYRLSVLTIELPPLRERSEDIPVLIDFFFDESCKRHHKSRPPVSLELSTFLESYDWPGNVRQLRNAIENLVVMGSRDILTLDDLPSFLSGGPISQTLTASSNSSLQEIERAAILGALERSLGNRTHAANTLGISVRTLQRKLKQWGIPTHDQSE